MKLNYQLPAIHDYLLQLKESKIFSKIDLKNGYYQIAMKETDKPKTAFNLMGRTYQFRRMPFGLSNAPRIFQQTMVLILGDKPYVKFFLDNILIHSKSEEEHPIHIEEVIKTPHGHRISINFEKSSFAKEEVHYLGHIISAKGIKPDIEKVKKLRIPMARTRKDVQKLVGFLNWFRPFVKDLSNKLNSIYDKIKSERVDWTQKDTETVQQILHEIESQTILHYPDMNKPFTLHTDASETGLGGILSKEQKIVGIYSYKPRCSELNYSVVEREMLAIFNLVIYFNQ